MCLLQLLPFGVATVNHPPRMFDFIWGLSCMCRQNYSNQLRHGVGKTSDDALWCLALGVQLKSWMFQVVAAVSWICQFMRCPSLYCCVTNNDWEHLTNLWLRQSSTTVWPLSALFSSLHLPISCWIRRLTFTIESILGLDLCHDKLCHSRHLFNTGKPWSK